MSTERKTILVVDDDPTILSLLHKVLQNDYDILLAEHGGTALKILIEARHVDLLMTGIKMEPVDGVQLIG